MYPTSILPPIYKALLRISLGRGAHTLAKLDTYIFEVEREVTIDREKKVVLRLPPDPHFFRYLLQDHERHVSRAIAALVNSGDVVVDVGANIGYFMAHAAAAAGTSGLVVCLEPEETNFNYLKSNCDLLNARGFNCRPHKVAASSTQGQAYLNLHEFSTYHALEDEVHHLDRVKSKQIINTVRLDQWSAEQSLSKITFLKIDAEGHEPKVLDGARSLFSRGLVEYSILECRSSHISEYVDEFCEEFGLHQLAWDGQKWIKSRLQHLPVMNECLISIRPVEPRIL